MATTYDKGDVIRVQNKYTTSTESTNGADPSNVEFHYTPPDGTTISATATSTGGLVRASSGVYFYDIITTSSGQYDWMHRSTGNVQTTVQGWFSVRKSLVTT